ncbi:MAG TPA: MarR family transcriptional regulator [Vitreimonas sp.]|uniref:MarR family winged helix-turn-helix transcriptional regulator n=1 Tax=Vitreimonas sp. TaxID=3069702 RepID=UPI002D5C05D2|nr:MarR family transcriptional regulator [Vitreimonas sp.]HYD88462.1 MarR family transcriptional regulator [Vitreimonas sp.]
MSDESEAFRLATSPSHLLHRAEQLAGDRFAQLVEDRVTLRQFAVLAAISETPGLSQSDLVRATGVDRSTVGDMMNRMERNGWITRTASESDARAHAVHLAPEGARLLAAATHHARAADAAILDALPRTKRRTFLNVLTKLAKLSDDLAEKAERDARKQAKKEARAKAAALKEGERKKEPKRDATRKRR